MHMLKKYNGPATNNAAFQVFGNQPRATVKNDVKKL